MIDLTLFSQRLDDAIKASGMKQIELADKIGVSQQTISSYVRAATTKKQPSLQNLVDIADALEVSLDWLLGRSIKEPKELGSSTVSCLDVYKKIEDLIAMTNGELTTCERRYIDTDGIDSSGNGEYEKVLQVSIRAPALSQYLANRKTMLALRNKETIDSQLFDAWEEGALAKLDMESYQKLDACIPYREKEIDLPF